MSSPSDNMMEVTIPPKPMDKPQRTSGDKHSGGSIGFIFPFVYFLKVFMACGIYVTPITIVLHNDLAFGIFGLVYNYVLTALCLYILAANNTHRSKTYPEFVKTTFDHGSGCFPKASTVFKIFVTIFGFTFSFCICSLYLSFVTSHICQVIVVNSSSYHNINFRSLTLVLALILIVLCFAPIWSSLAVYIIALIGLIFQVLAIFIGFVYLFDDTAKRTYGEKFAYKNLLLYNSYVIYAGEGINLFFPIIAAMKKPKKVLGCPSLLCAGMITLAAFALVLSGAGACKMYSIAFFIFLGTPSTTLGQVVKILAAMGIFCTYPLQLNAAYHYIVDDLHTDNKNLIKYGFRALLVRCDSLLCQSKYHLFRLYVCLHNLLQLLTLVLAMLTPFHFHYFMGLLDSSCLSVLIFMVPGLTPFCTKNYGTVYWMGIVAVIALLEAITAFIAGTVMNIIEWSRADYSGYETFC